MKTLKIYYTLLILISVVSCDTDFGNVIDFRKVEDQNITKNTVLGTKKSSLLWLQGIEDLMGSILNTTVTTAEIGSDNYKNIGSYYNNLLDGLSISINDGDINRIQRGIARLRRMAKFGLEEMGPKDEVYTKKTEAEYHFFEGISYLYAGMYFSYLPQTSGGKPASSQENFKTAIKSFKKANEINSKPEYLLAMARAYYFMGDKVNALDMAKKTLQKDKKFIRESLYDLSGNTVLKAIYERRQRDLQPLPSLDFLDPKYSPLKINDKDPGIAYLKAEEAYLIIAEIAHSNNDIIEFQEALNDLLDLVSLRKVSKVRDSGETRKEGKVQRPNKSTIVVNGRSGLVLDRTSSTLVPAISGTSLKKSDVSLLGIDNESLEILYRTRQEIFIAEGMRLVDMGVKLVMSSSEISQNKNVFMGDKGTKSVVPPFIDSIRKELDDYDYNKSAGTVTIKHDINKILVENKTSPLVLPFH